MSSREYYDVLAEEYEKSHEFWQNPYDIEVWRLEHETIGPYLDPNQPLLDVACGFYPHGFFTPSVRIFAGDISFGSLMVARDHPPRDRRVDLMQFDAHHLPFRDNTFIQVIAGGELLNHVDYRPVIAELARVVNSNGILLITFSTKWCIDSWWAILDSFLGHPIGYSLTREQARSFFRCNGSDVRVTWEITPQGQFTVDLMTRSNVYRALGEAGLKIEQIVGTNCLSGIIPLPYQQSCQRPVVHKLVRWMIWADRLWSRVFPFKLFAGHLFVLCRRF